MTEPADVIAEIRELINLVRVTDLDEAAADGKELDELRARIRSVREVLEPHVVDGVRMQVALRTAGHFAAPGSLPPSYSDFDPEEFFPYSPIVGTMNPISPPLHIWIDGDRVRGEGRLGAPYNGPPGAVHGGHVAAVLDELLGCAGVMTGRGGFTGTLTIRYEAPTPIDTDLELEGWVDRVEGRKMIAMGEIRAEGIVRARAEGVFIRPRLEE